MVGDEVYMQTLPSLFGQSKGCLGCDASTCACRRTPADDKNFSGRVRWAGIDEMYFMLAVANPDEKEAVCRLGGLKHGVLHTTVAFSERGIAHQGSFVSWNFKVYSGPKIQERLDAVRLGEVDPKLGEAVDYGFFWIIGRPMIFLMKKIHVVVGNWGIAIILLTLLIKLLTLPLTMKQMRSMKGMAKLKPEMDKLKEKYGDDKQRFQQEMWALYKAHKINPLGGCFPLLIQMPIYIAWYQALMVSVDLYQAPLFGWITDLTKPDVAFHVAGMGVPILPLFMGATMFLQQRMTPTTVDSAQQKMMMYMMPAMFTFFMLFLPSGLTLYILTNTLLTMIHQWYMNHAD
jgi:YidC/Oxa1 family membrane protein insertase